MNEQEYIEKTLEEMSNCSREQIAKLALGLLYDAIGKLRSGNDEHIESSMLDMSMVSGYLKSHCMSDSPTPLMLSGSMMREVEITIKDLNKSTGE